jgi:hypothetical protein
MAGAGAGSPQTDPPEVRAHLNRLLSSPEFQNKEKLKAFLHYVVEAVLSGQADRIKQTTVGVDALGYAPAEVSEATVRAHARRLRVALNQYYAGTGQTERLRIELPKGRYIPVIRLAAEPASSPKPDRWLTPKRLFLITVLSLSCCMFAVIALKVLRDEFTPLRQVTRFSGSTDGPAASGDGRLIVYASDREGSKDIWIRRLDSGEEARLSRNPSDEFDPDISSDGRWVAYRSMQEGGGIWVVPAHGGTPRRFSDGYSPRFSPDGRSVAFSAITESGDYAVFVSPLEGGSRRKISGDLSDAGFPVWSPDGSRLLFRAVVPQVRPKVYDWWLARSDGAGPPAQTGASQQLEWVAKGVFAADWSGDRVLVAQGGIYEMALAPDGHFHGKPRSVHPGSHVFHPRYLGRAKPQEVVFALGSEFTDLWGLPSASNSGRLTGERRRWTNDQSLAWRQETVFSSVSARADKVAYASLPGTYGNWLELTVQQLPFGESNVLTKGSRDSFRPILNRAGTRVAYSTRAPQPDASGRTTSIRIMSLQDRTERIVCHECGEIRDWSADEDRILSVRDGRLVEIDTRDPKERVVFDRPGRGVIEASYSPDGKWLGIALGGMPNREAGILALHGGQPDDWIPVATEPNHLALHWSPDGTLVYYFSRRDGYRCLWARRLDLVRKRPAGEAFAVAHFHDRRAQVLRLGWAVVVNDWIGLNLSHQVTNLYVARLGAGAR